MLSPIGNLKEANGMKKQENLKCEPSGRFKEIMAKEDLNDK